MGQDRQYVKKVSPSKSNSVAERFEVKETSELLEFLLQVIGNRGRNTVKSILARGQVSINGKKTTQYNEPLKSGDVVEVNLAKKGDSKKLEGVTILYEDEDILVVDKKEGLLTIASDKEKQLTAYRQLTDYVQTFDPKQRIFIIHRLDRDTSGVLMFAKSQEIQQKLQNDWKNSVSERTYIALVEGQIKKKTGTITSWLKETRTHLMYSSNKPNGGQKAVTHYAVLKASDKFSLLQVNLETGRKNQIRVHMQDIGHPVVGDKKYGGRGNPIGRLGLHAHILSFKHPQTGKIMRFESPVPKRFNQLFK
ncbi:RluA family pseudouridine synthase [Pullulanibacillus sp. KACC 23026]|uniref:RluA family pseudouridine synthase n=1 Tax=Pullulanibacillus sp. KACC 23026 TaxID=3028315 RepID=UPI0023B0640E|nr:RluA family pseudouridine synthase [Pullulanibacillus sp. KACC 23026]WEG12313.1 RluA family pseudouridine synthase [Pullulanibacillus sp. KACC 23026]